MFVTLREIQHFTAIMDEAAGLKATGKFPKALLIMLNTLIDENGLRSWQIYTDNFGKLLKAYVTLLFFTTVACHVMHFCVTIVMEHILSGKLEMPLYVAKM